MSDEYTEQYYSNNDLAWGQILWWFFIVFFILLSTVSLSLIFYLLVNNEWDIAQYYSSSVIDFTISTFPFYLLLPVVFSILLAVTFLKITNIGKRISLYLSFISILFSVLLLSLLFFYVGISKKTNNLLNNYEFYGLVLQNREKIWQSPDFGLLSGEIGAITDLDNFLLIDFDAKVWTITSTDPKTTKDLVFSPGSKIKIIGKKNNETVFEAKSIKNY